MRYKNTAIAAGIVVCFAIAVNSSAYTLYTREKAAAMINEQNSYKLSEINSLFEAVLEQTKSPETSELERPEDFELAELYTKRIELSQEYQAEIERSSRCLAEKLIDYDVALKKLRVLVSRYESKLENAKILETSIKTGECDEKTLSNAKNETNGIYLKICSLIFDISVIKSEIENITGETLKDDFDFDSVYFITDALMIKVAQSGYQPKFRTICQPARSEFAEYEAHDSSAEFASAVQAYYKLGETIREYLSAAADIKRGESSYRLGQISQSELAALAEAKEDKFLAAAQAKADFSKALFTLDENTGRGLTFDCGISSEEIEALRGTLTESRSGTGLWFCICSANGTMFCAASLPAGTYRSNENDTALYKYVVRYGETIIGSAPTGEQCMLSEISYEDGNNYAEVAFYQNDAEVGVYKLDIFAPYGGFIG